MEVQLRRGGSGQDRHLMIAVMRRCVAVLLHMLGAIPLIILRLNRFVRNQEVLEDG
jgi:hypothetical protein